MRTLIETANDKQFSKYFCACQQFQNTNMVLEMITSQPNGRNFLVGKRQQYRNKNKCISEKERYNRTNKQQTNKHKIEKL